MKRNSAASGSARTTFCATVDTNASAASWLVDLVNRCTNTVRDGHPRNTAVEAFRDRPQRPTVGGHGHGVEATAFARCSVTCHRTMHGHDGIT